MLIFAKNITREDDLDRTGYILMARGEKINFDFLDKLPKKCQDRPMNKIEKCKSAEWL